MQIFPLNTAEGLLFAVITDYLYEALALECEETESELEDPLSTCLAYGGPCLECSYRSAFISAAFYISFFWIGQFVLLTVFLAILFQSCSMEEILTDTGREEQPVDLLKAHRIIAAYGLKRVDSISIESVVDIVNDLRDTMEEPDSDISVDCSDKNQHCIQKITESMLVEYLYKIDRSRFRKMLYISGMSKAMVFLCIPFSVIKASLGFGSLGLRIIPARRSQSAHLSRLFDGEPESLGSDGGARAHQVQQKPMIIWRVARPMIKTYNWILIYVAKSMWLDIIVVLAILTGTLFQALEPSGEKFPSVISRDIFDMGFKVCSCIFAFEFFTKATAFGLFQRTFMQQPSYLQNSWHILDISLLIITVFAHVWNMLGYDIHQIQEAICIVRTLSLLRPMRKIKGVKTILDSLLSATKPICFALLFLLMIMIIFGVIGMSLFSDKFKFCNNEDLDGRKGEGVVECCGTFLGEDDILVPQVWSNPASDFDSISTSLLSLSKAFKIGWIEIWFTASDISGVGIQPEANENIIVASIFFISYMVCVSFFSVTLFANFICDGTLSASDSNNFEFTEIQKFISTAWPELLVKPPSNLIQRGLRGILESKLFSTFSIGCIILNFIGMSLVHRGQDDIWSFWLNLQNDIFFAVYAAETLAGVIGWGPTLFFKKPLNRLDTVIVCAVYCVQLASPQNRKAVQILRLFRLYRVFRLAVTQSITMHAVFETLEGSIAQAINICTVLLLFLTVFATIAVQLFGTTRFGERLGTTANFYEVSTAILTLIQILFGDEVEKLVDDCSIQPPFCTEEFRDPVTGLSLGSGDCGSDFAVLFFVAFTVVCDFTCMNLFVGYAIVNNCLYIFP